MVPEGSAVLQATFLLAVLGYAGMTAVVVAERLRRLPVAAWRVTSLVILAHVALIWVFRYEGRLALAVRNGWTGFLVFHAAVALILASHLAPPGAAARLLHVAFLVVSAGAAGAVFRYEDAAFYRAPVILCGLTGSAVLVRSWLRDRKEPAAGRAA